MANTDLSIHKRFRRLMRAQSSEGQSTPREHGQEIKRKLQKKRQAIREESVKNEAKMEVLKPVVCLRDWKYPEEHVDTRILTDSIARQPKGVPEESKEPLPPWRSLLRVPEVGRAIQNPQERDLKKKTILQRVKTHDAAVSRRARAEGLLRLMQERGEDSCKISAKIKERGSEISESKEKLFPPENKKPLHEVISVEFRERLSEMCAMTPSEQFGSEIKNLLQSSGEDLSSTIYDSKFTDGYMKKSVAEKPSLEHYREFEKPNTGKFDVHMFRKKKAARELTKHIAEGEVIDIDLKKYAADETKFSSDILENLTDLEDSIARELMVLGKRQDLKRWDEKYADFVKFYLRDSSGVPYTEDVRSDQLQKGEVVQGDFLVTGLRSDQFVLCRSKSSSEEMLNPTANEKYPRASVVHNCTDVLLPLAQTRKTELPYTGDPYDEEVAEMKYLQSKPICFMIVGKETADVRRLAERIADLWGGVLVDGECFIYKKFSFEEKFVIKLKLN